MTTAPPRRKLTADLIPRARELAELGLPLALIADALGVHRGTLHRWRKEAGPEGLERDLSDAIQEGQRAGMLRLLGQIREAGAADWRAAAWALTHDPVAREHFSDAAAERRTERKTMGAVVDALAAAALTPADERRVLLQFQARGLGTGDPEP